MAAGSQASLPLTSVRCLRSGPWSSRGRTSVDGILGRGGVIHSQVSGCVRKSEVWVAP